MKLNTKKGGIELHADEKRVLDKAQKLLRDIHQHGNAGQAKAALDAGTSLVALGQLLAEQQEAIA